MLSALKRKAEPPGIVGDVLFADQLEQDLLLGVECHRASNGAG